MASPDQEKVTLVATDTLTPYRKGEVFTVTRAQADRLLTRDMTMTDFGPRNPEVKVREYNPDKDERLLLDNHVLNAEAHTRLEKKLNGDEDTNDETEN